MPTDFPFSVGIFAFAGFVSRLAPETLWFQGRSILSRSVSQIRNVCLSDVTLKLADGFPVNAAGITLKYGMREKAVEKRKLRKAADIAIA